MSLVTMQFTKKVNVNGVVIEKSISVTGTGVRRLVEESIANGATDQEIEFALDVSALKGIYIVSTKDITLETNDGTTPAKSIALQADKAFEWNAEDGYFANPFGVTDVTSIFLTNASGAAALLTIEAVYDPTPA